MTLEQAIEKNHIYEEMIKNYEKQCKTNEQIIKTYETMINLYKVDNAHLKERVERKEDLLKRIFKILSDHGLIEIKKIDDEKSP